MANRKINLNNIAYKWPVLLMLLPTIILVATFSYVPALEAIRHAFYEWDGGYTENFVWLKNFQELFGDLTLWIPLAIGGMLLLGGACSVDERKRRILLRIGQGVWIFAAAIFLFDAWNLPKGTSLLPVLAWTIPAVIAGLYLLKGLNGKSRNVAAVIMYLSLFCMAVSYIVAVRKSGDWLLWMSFRLIFILVAANLLKMLPSIFTAVCINRLHSDRSQYLYRVLFVIPMIIPSMVGLLIWKFFYDPNIGPLNKIFISTGLDKVMIWLDKWVLHLGVFQQNFKPAWLGEPSLVIPALIFWGFPWVGVVGVLIYLSGLQNIGTDIYEAAEIDGIGWWGKFTHIELPLIMGQVRLNLIMMIIGTFQAYGFELILLGPAGGPSNKGLTPGLYMFYQGFMQQRYGYACAIGLALFFIILVLTVINQRFVKVEK